MYHENLKQREQQQNCAYNEFLNSNSVLTRYTELKIILTQQPELNCIIIELKGYYYENNTRKRRPFY